MIAMLKKELRTYFTSMTGYVFIGFFTLITAIFYSSYCLQYGVANFIPILSQVTLVLLLLIPTITMRLLAEETKQKTDQLLLTSPITVKSIVLGKYFSAIILFLITLLIISLFPIMLIPFGRVEAGTTITAFIAFFLLGICFISVGLFISSITDNQIISAVTSFGILLVMFIMDSLVQGLPKDRLSSVIFAIVVLGLLAFFVYNNTKSIYASLVLLIIGVVIISGLYFGMPTIFDGLIVNFFGWFSVMKRLENFYLGILDIGSIVYYISFSAVFVYLTIQVIEKRRWS